MAAATFAALAFPASAADLYIPDSRSERYTEVYTYERDYRRPPRVTVIEPVETETVVIERRPVIVEREVVIEPRVYERRVYEPRVYDDPVYAREYPTVRYESWRRPRAYYRY
jgi:hypothetical protein